MGIELKKADGEQFCECGKPTDHVRTGEAPNVTAVCVECGRIVR